jgi:RNA polymerase sigma-32 factor
MASSSSPWFAYLARVRQHRKLTPIDEARLVHRLRATGDRASARALVTAHLRLVVTIARGFRRLHPNLLELVQEGNLALIRAVHRYDPARPVTLSAYAASWVRTYIGRFVLANLDSIDDADISSTRAVIARNLDESVRGWAAGIDEGDGYGDDEERDEVLDPEAVALALMAQQSAEASELFEAREEEALLVAMLPELEREMSPRERDVFNARFASDSSATLAQTGARLGLSGERVRQIEEKLTARLRSKVASRVGRAPLH